VSLYLKIGVPELLIFDFFRRLRKLAANYMAIISRKKRDIDNPWNGTENDKGSPIVS